MKREDFRDALRLAVLQVAKRFNRKLDLPDLNEYVDDLMANLRPKELAQLPKLLAAARRENRFFPTTGEIRSGIVGRGYSEIIDGTRLLPEGNKPPDWEEMTAESLNELTETIKAQAAARQREENAKRPRPNPATKQPLKKTEFRRLGEGMTEEQFRQMIRKQQTAAQEWANQHTKGSDVQNEKH